MTVRVILVLFSAIRVKKGLKIQQTLNTSLNLGNLSAFFHVAFSQAPFENVAFINIAFENLTFENCVLEP